MAQALQSFGYRIFPVRPLVTEVLGEKAYPDLESLPELPDIVDVFRAPEHVPAIVDSCIRLGVKNLWLQDGVVHEEAALRAQAGGHHGGDGSLHVPRLHPVVRNRALNKPRCAWCGDDPLYQDLPRYRMGRAVARRPRRCSSS